MKRAILAAMLIAGGAGAARASGTDNQLGASVVLYNGNLRLKLTAANPQDCLLPHVLDEQGNEVKDSRATVRAPEFVAMGVFGRIDQSVGAEQAAQRGRDAKNGLEAMIDALQGGTKGGASCVRSRQAALKSLRELAACLDGPSCQGRGQSAGSGG